MMNDDFFYGLGNSLLATKLSMAQANPQNLLAAPPNYGMSVNAFMQAIANSSPERDRTLARLHRAQAIAAEVRARRPEMQVRRQTTVSCKDCGSAGLHACPGHATPWTDEEKEQLYSILAEYPPEPGAATEEQNFPPPAPRKDGQ